MAEPVTGSVGPDRSAGRTGDLQEHAFEFRGKPGEYFRIWIVNIFLTLVTLGIYSAWAKVRTQRYFASSTILAGASFAYLAEPLSILKGRLLVLGFLLLYGTTSELVPALEPVLALGLLALIPWAIVRSMAFRAHNTAWRNLRFRFDAPYDTALRVYLGLPIAAALSLGILYPYAVYRQKRLLVDHAAFGTTPFRMTSQAGAFYRVFAVIGMILLLAIVVAGAAFAFADASSLVVVAVATLPLYFYLGGYYSSQTANLAYHDATLGEHRLASRVPAAGLAMIYFTNSLAMLVSLGLLVPWARIRMARFRLDHMSVYASGSLEDFAAAQAEEVASLGAELGEALDLDLGL